MYIIAYDLGTGGMKASLYNEQLCNCAQTFKEYDTFYPAQLKHEQRLSDWWEALICCTRRLFEKSGISAKEVSCVSLSGSSSVSVPIGKDGKALLEQVPIWSDTRAKVQTERFFERIPEKYWYMETGNGFPAACYPLFKLMWFQEQVSELIEKTKKILGSKDYINYLLTGVLATDHSYLSGSGAYSLKQGRIKEEFLEAAGIPGHLFPEAVDSHQVIGTVTTRAADQTGLAPGTKVVCGGVDNACMALGAVGAEEGGVYTSLGSSSWIPVNSSKPILDFKKKPYVFAHIQERMFTSAFSIFSGGSSLRWVRENLCRDLKGENIYMKMDELAAQVPPGSNGVIFNPSLAGGTSQDKSLFIQGAYLGLHLGNTREDMIRAALEGIAMNLRLSLDYWKERIPLSQRILFCGGGSKSPVWMQLFADIFGQEIIKTNIDQDAASLGAAAIAARGIGLWKDYRKIPSLHQVERRYVPDPVNQDFYNRLLPVFQYANGLAAELGEYMHQNAIGGEK